MAKETSRIENIIVRRLMGLCDPDESAELDLWLEEDPRNRDLYDRVCSAQNISDNLGEHRRLQGSKAPAAAGAKKRLRTFRRVLPYAASVAVLVVATWMIVRTRDDRTSSENNISVIASENRRAILTLSNGEKVMLGGAPIDLSDGMASFRARGGEIDYLSEDGSDNAPVHILTTSRGSEYTVTLSDGTKVRLNALSELRYSAVFAESERRVELIGEAYFEVFPDAERPFIVETRGYGIYVLGTSFNVNAYPEQNKIFTTLCTGKVAVRDLHSDNVIEMNPGEELTGNVDTRAMTVCKVNTATAIAWIDGYFRFDDTTIDRIMETLQRWYDVDVVYNDPLAKDEVFTGKLPRFDDISMITTILESVSSLSFRLDGRTLHIDLYKTR